jgi:hypothetical protein
MNTVLFPEANHTQKYTIFVRPLLSWEIMYKILLQLMVKKCISMTFKATEKPAINGGKMVLLHDLYLVGQNKPHYSLDVIYHMVDKSDLLDHMLPSHHNLGFILVGICLQYICG